MLIVRFEIWVWELNETKRRMKFYGKSGFTYFWLIINMIRVVTKDIFSTTFVSTVFFMDRILSLRKNSIEMFLLQFNLLELLRLLWDNLYFLFEWNSFWWENVVHLEYVFHFETIRCERWELNRFRIEIELVVGLDR